jgi:hypothetical protein
MPIRTILTELNLSHNRNPSKQQARIAMSLNDLIAVYDLTTPAKIADITGAEGTFDDHQTATL